VSDPAQTRLQFLIRVAAVVALTAVAVVLLNRVLWTVLPDSTGIAFLVWAIGFAIVGAAIAAIASARWGSLALAGIGGVIGTWIGLQLPASDIPAAFTGPQLLFAAALPLLVGFLLTAQRRGWLGSSPYDEDHPIPLARPVPGPLPTGGSRAEEPER
jgi:uncharacterized membrane protein